MTWKYQMAQPLSLGFIIVICTIYILIVLPAFEKNFADRDSACTRIESETLPRSPHSSSQGVFNENINAHEVYVNPRFYLYRLIGNNMPPLQCFGQLLKNTRYTLDHEPLLADCKRLWVLNNIVNATERALILDLLISRGYTLQDIIIRRVNFSQIAALPRESWTSAVTAAPCSVKAAQNEARNDIIRHGKLSGARWILAFDGNQFYTEEAWRAITAAAIRHEEVGLKYFKVPMYRLYSEQKPAWLHQESEFHVIRHYAPVLWESQIAFRNDSDQLYSEGMLYGKDNKLDLLDKLCGNGNFKKDDPYSGNTGKCGCHLELGSDRKQREIDEEVALKCGYSIRLWYHPCEGVNGTRIFVDRMYRAKLRNEGLKSLGKSVAREVESVIESRSA